jgi:2'-5' RNA ligase
MRQAMVHAVGKSARASGGRPVPAANLHVTLAFLGSVPERRMAELAEIARATASAPALASAGMPTSAGMPRSPPRAARKGASNAEGRLELTFDHLEHWRAAQLLCALPAEPPVPSAPTKVLARRLQEQLVARGFAPDLKPFRPHVTVARKVSRPGRMENLHPVVWSFTGLALVESRTLREGALYSVVESYPING